MDSMDFYTSNPLFYGIVEELVTVTFWDKCTKFSIALTAAAYLAREVCKLKSVGSENSDILVDAIKRVCGHVIRHHKVIEERFEGVKQTMFAVLEYLKQAASGALEAGSRALEAGSRYVREAVSGAVNRLRQVSSVFQNFLLRLAIHAQSLIRDNKLAFAFIGGVAVGGSVYAYSRSLGLGIFGFVLATLPFYLLASRFDQDELEGKIERMMEQAERNPEVLFAAAVA